MMSPLFVYARKSYEKSFVSLLFGIIEFDYEMFQKEHND